MLNKPLKEEILDQVLHVLSNFFIVTFLVFLGTSLYTSVLVAIGYTFGREIYQRLRGGNNWYDLEEFKSAADLIVANRLTGEIQEVASKVYTRDIFGVD